MQGRTDSKEEGPNTWKGECGNISFSREANSFGQIVFLFSVRTDTSTTMKTVPKDPVKTICITPVTPVMLERSDQDPGSVNMVNKTVKLNYAKFETRTAGYGNTISNGVTQT